MPQGVAPRTPVLGIVTRHRHYYRLGPDHLGGIGGLDDGNGVTVASVLRETAVISVIVLGVIADRYVVVLGVIADCNIVVGGACD